MPLINDRAICVRRHEFSETSQILSLLTARHGMIRVIARGAHRATKAGASKFDGGIDLLDEGDALFTDRVEKDLNTLAEWKLIDGHRGLRRAQRSIYLALHLSEVVGSLFEAHDPHPGLFERFRQTLRDLATPSLEEAAISMVIDLVGEAGLEPYLGACVSCGASTLFARALWFSPERGGVLCRACEALSRDRLGVDPRSIAIASFLQRLQRDPATPPPRLTRQRADPLHVLFARHLEANVGRPMRTLRWVADPRRGVAVPAPRCEATAPPDATPAAPAAAASVDAAPVDAIDPAEPIWSEGSVALDSPAR